jgi:hypothetical protein
LAVEIMISCWCEVERVPRRQHMGNEDVIETTVRVRYAETDAMGIVYHTNYIVWFEVGRGEFLRQRGGNYRRKCAAAA